MTMPIIMIIGVVFFLLIALIAVFITKYRTAGPDEALIVTGVIWAIKMFMSMKAATVSKSSRRRNLCPSRLPAG